jgi:hypothetical protein
MIETIITTQREQIDKFLLTNYNVDINKIDNCIEYLNETIKGILTLKIWSDSLN